MGGKKESNILAILQTSLFLNTSEGNIKIVQLYKNSHESWVPLSRFLDDYQVPGMQIIQGEIPLSIFYQFYNPGPFVFIISRSDLNQIG